MQFSEEEMQMTNRHTESCSISLMAREMQIKPTGCHFSFIGLAIIKKATACRIAFRFSCDSINATIQCWSNLRILLGILIVHGFCSSNITSRNLSSRSTESVPGTCVQGSALRIVCSRKNIETV